VHSSSNSKARSHSQTCPRCQSELYLTLFRASDRLYRTTDRRFNVVECADCALMRLDPMPDAEELKSFYPESYWWHADESAASRLAELYRDLVLRDHVHFVAQALSSEGPLLDIGCGGGSFLHAMRREKVPLFGLDTSWRAAHVASSRFHVPAACGALPNLPYRRASFGTITLFHVLEHVPDPMAALRSIAGLLKPSGKFVVQVPNADCWQLLLLGERWSGLDVPRHLTNFRADDLEELLGACGFIVKRRKFFSLRDNPAGLATSLAPQLEPVSRRVRAVKESAGVRLLKDCLYFCLVVASVPFALLEAASAAGSSVMMEAVLQGER